jgi:PAS domain S-box-containing protein
VKDQESTKIQNETSLNAGYFICDKRGRFLSANDLLMSITGYTENELLELAITDLMSKEDEQEILSDIYQQTNFEETSTFTLEIINKVGERKPVELKVRIITGEDEKKKFIGFRGQVTPLPEKPSTPLSAGGIPNQSQMIAELVDIVHLGYNEPLGVLLKRVSESICQIFGFKRSTVALLDRRKRAFVKQAMVGYAEGEDASIEKRSIEVPQEVIDKIFADRYRIKVIYHSQDQRDTREYLSPGIPERRTQKRSPVDQWHKKDLILLNLMDYRGNTFGYISLDDPLKSNFPTRTTFYNLELFSNLVSMAIENFYRFSNLEKKNRRLKQVLVNSNIFKLYLSLNELLKEVVWSVKFTLDFNLVKLVLISKKSGLLETKAVACSDKIKMLQIKELKYDLKAFSDLLKDEYRHGKSYLISDEEDVLRHLKRIYYGASSNHGSNKTWPQWALLLVPIKSREGKIIGFLMADDPADCRLPSRETLSVLEIMANQIAIAIDNRVMYVQAKEKIQKEPKTSTQINPQVYEEKEDDYAGGGLRKLVEKFLR